MYEGIKLENVNLADLPKNENGALILDMKEVQKLNLSSDVIFNAESLTMLENGEDAQIELIDAQGNTIVVILQNLNDALLQNATAENATPLFEVFQADAPLLSLTDINDLEAAAAGGESTSDGSRFNQLSDQINQFIADNNLDRNDPTGEAGGTDVTNPNFARDITFSGDLEAVVTEDLGQSEEGIITGTIVNTDPHYPSLLYIAQETLTENGLFRLLEDGTWIFNLDESNPDIQGLDDLQSILESFTVEVQGQYASFDLEITINGLNDKPSVEDISLNDASSTWLLGATRTYVEQEEESDGPGSPGSPILYDTTGASEEDINALFAADQDSVVVADLFPEGSSTSPNDGAAMKFNMNVSDGETVTFDWIFNDKEDDTEYNDFSFVVIDGKVIQLLAEVEDEGIVNTGTFTHTFQTGGEHSITFGVMNDDDNEVDSSLEVTYVSGGTILSTESVGHIEGVLYETSSQADAEGVDDTEAESNNIYNGEIAISDADYDNTHTLHIVSKTVTDPENAGITIEDNIEASLDLNTETGKWEYNIEGDFSHLAVGETSTLTIEYFADDNRGKSGDPLNDDTSHEDSISDTKTITLTITGTNDKPVILEGEEELILNGGFDLGFDNWDVGVTPTVEDGGRPFNIDSQGDGWSINPSIDDNTAVNGFDGGVEGFGDRPDVGSEDDLVFHLRQDFTLDSSTLAQTLSFDYSIQSGPWEEDAEPRVFEVQILDETGALVETVFTQSLGFNDSQPVDHMDLNLQLSAGNYTLQFLETIPQWFTGPSEFAIDNISLSSFNGSSDVIEVDETTSDGEIPDQFTMHRGTINGIDDDTNDQHTISLVNTPLGDDETSVTVLMRSEDLTENVNLDSFQAKIEFEGLNGADVIPTDFEPLELRFEEIVDEDGNFTYDYFFRGDFNALGFGESATVTLSYVVTDDQMVLATDGINEASDSEVRTITLKINGTNDQPEIIETQTAPITETHDAVAYADGSDNTQDDVLTTYTGGISGVDDDDNDTHTIALVGQPTLIITQDTQAPDQVEEADLPFGITFDPVVSSDGTFTTSYTLSGNFNALAAGETAKVTFQYAVTDSSGQGSEDKQSEVQTVELTITGTNDQPVVSSQVIEGHKYVVEQTHTIELEDNTIGYTYFTVTEPTTITITTDGPTIDPNMYLLHNDSPLTSSSIIDYNDDGHTPAGDFNNSIITWTLQPGNYIAAVSDYYLDEQELFDGFNDISDINPMTGDVTLTFTSDKHIDVEGEKVENTFVYETHDTEDVIGDDDTQDEEFNVLKGSLSVTDDDITDTHLFNVLDMPDLDGDATADIKTVDINYVDGPVQVQLESDAINVNDIDLVDIILSNNDGADRTVDFGLKGDFSHLAEGETATVTFAYNAVDDSGATNESDTSETKTVTITVTGTNDQPIVEDIVMGNIQTTIFEENTPVRIPDNEGTSGQTLSTITVSSLDELQDLDVIVNLDHTYSGDLAMFLVSPEGTRVQLTLSDLSRPQDDYTDTEFDDDASTGIESANAPYTGVFKPVGDLSEFEGENPNGEWTLEINDVFSIDEGTLNSWKLEFNNGLIFETSDTDATDSNNDDILRNDEQTNIIAGTLTVTDEDINDVHLFDIVDMTSGNRMVIIDTDDNAATDDGQANVELTSDIDIANIALNSITLLNNDAADRSVDFELDGDFTALAAGETATVVFAYNAANQNNDDATPGESNTSEAKTVTMTITGTNDQPVVDAVILGIDDVTTLADERVYESHDDTTYQNNIDDTQDNDFATKLSGKLVVTDDDVTDTHLFSLSNMDDTIEQGEDIKVVGVTYDDGVASTTDTPVMIQVESTFVDVNNITLDSIALLNNDEADREVNFDLVGNFNALGEGESATITFKFFADDQNGFDGTGRDENSASEEKTVTITVTGTNDQPIITNINTVTADEHNDLASVTYGSNTDIALSNIAYDSKEGSALKLVVDTAADETVSLDWSFSSLELANYDSAAIIIDGVIAGTVDITSTNKSGTFEHMFDTAGEHTITFVVSNDREDDDDTVYNAELDIQLNPSSQGVVVSIDTFGAVTGDEVSGWNLSANSNEDVQSLDDFINLEEVTYENAHLSGTLEDVITVHDDDNNDDYSYIAFDDQIVNFTEVTNGAPVITTPIRVSLDEDGNYDVISSSFDKLGENETVTITFEVQVKDDSTIAEGGDTHNEASLSEPKLVTIEISGSNDTPVLGAITVADVMEPNLVGLTNLVGLEEIFGEWPEDSTVDGMLPDVVTVVTDEDVNDTHVYVEQGSYSNDWDPAFATVIDTNSVIQEQTFLKVNADGSFNVFNPSFNNLGVDEEVTVQFSVEVTDGTSNGENPVSNSQLVSFVIKGTNDQPKAFDVTATPQSEIAGTADTVLDGTFNARDEDTNDLLSYHAVSMDPNTTAAQIAGAGFVKVTVPYDEDGNGAYEANIVIAVKLSNVNSEVDIADLDFTGLKISGRNFELEGDLNTLPLGEELIIKFQYNVDDNSGADVSNGYDETNISDTKMVTISVTGTQDAAQIEVPNGQGLGEVQEDGILTTDGVLRITDLDAGEAEFDTNFVTDPTNTTDYGTFSIGTDGAWSYSLNNSSAQELNGGVTATEKFRVYSEDGEDFTDITIKIHGAEDPSNIYIDSETSTDTNVGEVSEDTGMTPDVSLGYDVLTANGTLSITDVDSGDEAFSTVVSPVGTTLGTLEITSSGAWSYKVENGNSTVQALGVGQTITEEFVVSSIDGTSPYDDTQTITVTIKGTNDLPTVQVEANDISSDFVEMQGNDTKANAVLITDTLTIEDIDGDTIKSATIKITNFVSGEDELLFTDNILITGSFDETTGILTLSATNQVDGIAKSYFEDALNSVKYNNTSNTPNEDTRVLEYRVTDINDGTSLLLNQEVSVEAVNDTPVGIAEPDFGVIEDGTVFNGEVEATDVDTAVLTYELVGSAPEGLTFNSNGTYSFDPSDDAYQSLRAGQTTQVSFDWKATDGNTYTTTDTVTVTITGTNDGATIVNPENFVVEAEVEQNFLRLDPQGVVIEDASQLLDMNDFARVDSGVKAIDVTGTFGPSQNGNNWNDAFKFTVAEGETADISLVDQTPADSSVTLYKVDGLNIVEVQSADSEGVYIVRVASATPSNSGDFQIRIAINGDDVKEDVTTTVSGEMEVLDVDAGENVFQVLTDVQSPDAYGEFSITAAGTWEYDLFNNDQRIQALAEGEVLFDTFTVTSFDGTATEDVVIRIEGTNDAPTATAITLGDVDETAAPIVIDLLVNANDVDNGAVLNAENIVVKDASDTALPPASYTIVGNVITIDPAFFKAGLAAGVSLDVTVSYDVSDGMTSTPNTATVSIVGTDNDPKITDVTYFQNGVESSSTTIYEEYPGDNSNGTAVNASTVLAKVAAEDDDSNFAYSIEVASNTDGYFMIDSNGNVTLTGSGLTALQDSDINDQTFGLSVIVTDTDGNTDTRLVTIIADDNTLSTPSIDLVNDSDSSNFINPVTSKTDDLTNDKTPTFVFDDIDSDAHEVEIEINGNNLVTATREPDGSWDIDSDYGTLTPPTSPDTQWTYVLDIENDFPTPIAFELPDGEYTIEVKVTDDAGNVTFPAPELDFEIDTTPATIDTLTYTVAENQTLIGAVTATDLNDVVDIRLTNDSMNTNFEIVNGELKFINAIDFETQAHSYTAEIIATDEAGNETIQQVTVNVTDVNDNAPVVGFTAIVGGIDELSPIGSKIGDITVSDADSSAVNPTLEASKFVIGGTDAAKVQVVETSPGVFELQLAEVLDYEAPLTLLDLTLTYNDGVNTPATPVDADVSVNDINEAPEAVDDIIEEGTVLVSEDFETGASGWSNNSTDSSSGELGSFLGRFGSPDGLTAVSKTYDFGIANAGKTVTVEFDMYEIDSWDGEAFKVFINTVEVSTQDMKVDSHYGETDGGTSTASNEFTGWGSEDIHHYSFAVTLDASGKVELGFGSELGQSISDESFGIDNVSITAAEDLALVTEENTAIIIDVLANDTDVDAGDTISINSFEENPAAGGTVSQVGNNLEFDPGSDFDYLTDGATEVVTFKYDVKDADGLVSNEATVTITVTGTNDAPVLGVFASTNLIANGSFEDITGSLGSSHGWGHRVAGFDEWTETSNDGEHDAVFSGFAGVDTDGDYLVDMDGSGQNLSLSQDVAGVNDGETYLLSFDIAQYNIGTSAQLEVYWNGVLVDTYTPDGKTMKTISVEVVGAIGTNTVTFTEVGAADSTGTYLDNIVLQPSVLSVDENSVDGIVVGQAVSTDPDGGTAVYSLVDESVPFAIDSATGEITVDGPIDYEALGASKTIDIEVKVIDQNGGEDTQIVSVNVNNLNDNAPEVESKNLVMFEGSTDVDLELNVSDADGDTLSIQFTNLPTNGTVTLSDGTAVNTTTTYTVSDLEGLQFDATSVANSTLTYLVMDGDVSHDTTGTVNFNVQSNVLENGYEEYNGHYYKNFGTGSVSDARTKAIDENGKVVLINDANENAFVDGLVNGDVWVNATDENAEAGHSTTPADWTDFDGNPLDYLNFKSGEPNDYTSGGLYVNGEDYVEMHNGGLWNDIEPTGVYHGSNHIVVEKDSNELTGTSSDETLVFDDDASLIDGLTGEDTVTFSEPIIDIGAILANTEINNIEQLDLTNGAHILSNISASDVFSMTDGDNELKVIMDSDDTFDASASGWVNGSTINNNDGTQTTTYVDNTSISGETIKLLIQEDIV